MQEIKVGTEFIVEFGAVPEKETHSVEAHIAFDLQLALIDVEPTGETTIKKAAQTVAIGSVLAGKTDVWKIAKLKFKATNAIDEPVKIAFTQKTAVYDENTKNLKFDAKGVELKIKENQTLLFLRIVK